MGNGIWKRRGRTEEGGAVNRQESQLKASYLVRSGAVVVVVAMLAGGMVLRWVDTDVDAD